jgi:hypothetical protein
VTHHPNCPQAKSKILYCECEMIGRVHDAALSQAVDAIRAMRDWPTYEHSSDFRLGVLEAINMVEYLRKPYQGEWFRDLYGEGQ